MYKRTALSFFALMLFFGILIVNLFLINIKTEISPAAEAKNSRSLTLASSRGMIYDCNMKRLVNASSHSVTVMMPDSEAFGRLSPFLTDGERERVYKNTAQGKVSAADTEERFFEKNIKSVTVAERYGENRCLVHIIGHLDENGKGATGLEKAYESYLSRQSGRLKAVWSADARGTVLYGGGIDFVRENYLSPAGIQLTTDLEIQKIAEKALRAFNIGRGAVVVMDSATSEILACASYPEFDPDNIAASMADENAPFINRAAAPYSVGSVFKPFVAACAVENDIELTRVCTGSIKVGGTVFACNDNTAHGETDLRTAMERSCNAYFIALGQKVGAKKLLSLCSSLGLGKETELADNFYLKAGYLPTAEETSSLQDLANLSFGQGKLLASPIQLAAAYSCFANGGVYRPPVLMKGIIDENGKAVQRVRLSEGVRVIAKSTAERLDSILRSVVTDGNGSKAFSEKTDGRGKTATAQSGWYEGGREITHTWFCGYFTAGDRKITAVILKEDGVSGAADCAPVFRFISEEVTEYFKSGR